METATAADAAVAAAAADIVTASLARCTLSPALAAARRRKSPSSHAATSPFIVAIATRPKALVAQVIADHAGSLMSEVKVNPGDSFELALKRFNRKVQQDGILSEARRRSHYESPQARRKRKAEAQSRKRRRSARPTS